MIRLFNWISGKYFTTHNDDNLNVNVDIFNPAIYALAAKGLHVIENVFERFNENDERQKFVSPSIG